MSIREEVTYPKDFMLGGYARLWRLLRNREDERDEMH
jgi:hypothetical protein